MLETVTMVKGKSESKGGWTQKESWNKGGFSKKKRNEGRGSDAARIQHWW